MKFFRLLLLVVLTVLVPVRGAFAATMTCHVAGDVETSVSAPAFDDAADDAANMSHTHHAADVHNNESAGSNFDPGLDLCGATAEPEPVASNHHAGSHDKCHLCCDFGSVTPLIAALPSLLPLADLSVVTFPGFSAPSPSFIAGGQDRPPRTI